MNIFFWKNSSTGTDPALDVVSALKDVKNELAGINSTQAALTTEVKNMSKALDDLTAAANQAFEDEKQMIAALQTESGEIASLNQQLAAVAANADGATAAQLQPIIDGFATSHANVVAAIPQPAIVPTVAAAAGA
jgi:uncharacterized protein YoxC